MTKKRYTLSIDFDGTIVEHAFPEIGELKPGAKEAITELYEHFDIVISSCRASQLFRKTPTSLSAHRVIELVAKHVDVEWDGEAPCPKIDAGRLHAELEEYFHDCRPKAIPDMQRADGRDYVREMKDFLDGYGIPYTRLDLGDEGKVVAVAYIDDRAIPFHDNWADIVNKLMRRT